MKSTDNTVVSSLHLYIVHGVTVYLLIHVALVIVYLHRNMDKLFTELNMENAAWKRFYILAAIIVL